MSTNTKKRRQKADGGSGDGAASSRNRYSNKMEQVNIPESERLPLQLKISEFLASSDDEVVLKGLTNTHRKYLHQYALHFGLKTKSFGSKTCRELHIIRRKRLTTLDDVKPLNITPVTRKTLQNLLPTIQSHLGANHALGQSSTHRYKNINRSESLAVSLGPRMVPPRSQRISNELFRDKQELPIFHYQGEINQMLKQHNVFIVNGETGSGKTTQVPQYILNDATRRNKPCRIIVTQPRRFAAVSVAHRVAEERGEPLGETVGYQIRMERRVKKTSNLIYTTSGCFLRSIMADVSDLFRKVTHLIIDEIHERDKNTDFTLITIKEQLKLNKDLKVILMSATMDIQLLSKYFDNCPVLNVPGQGYDVKIYHLEDILYHTGYRTALMEKYLRSMNDNYPMPTTMFSDNILEMGSRTAERLEDEYLQQVLDTLIGQCCDAFECKSREVLHEMFDQIQYYMESEGMSVNAGHTETGITPLMAGCKCNMPEFVQFLIQRQANVLIRDNDGYEAIDYARLHQDGLCVQILMSASNCIERSKNMEELSQQDREKQKILLAYQQQFNDDNEVDHDLILSLLEGLYRNAHPGAVMVFLPGYNDIVQQRNLIQSTLPGGTYKLCILHGQMDSKDQFEALQTHPVRKIILSTNIGQTSITIPDLAYIIDSGKVKMNTYDSVTESSQLQSIWISQADACQRSGRSGRTQNGVCYRLYSSAKYQYMPQFSIPEFMRIPLTEICLYAKTLDPKCEVQQYLQKSLNPPSSLSIQNALKKLKILGVFRDDESVTELGKHLVDIPLDVQLGKCLLYGVFLKCYDPILTICSYHSVKDPFILPTDKSAQGQASFQRKSFAGQSFSDQMGILALHKAYMEIRHIPRKVRDFCNKYFLSHSAMEMFCATRRQINEVMKNKFNINYMDKVFNNEWPMTQLCLVAGFYPNVALVDRKALKLICGAEKQLILQRYSALNPPGKKHLKEFINQMPHDWIVFYEKSRISNTCTINMNTVVPSLMIALQCGRDCDLHDESELYGDDDDSDAELDGETGVDADDCTDGVAADDDLESEAEKTTQDVTVPPTNDFEIMQQKLAKTLKNISLSNDNTKTIMSLDNWVKFELMSGDAKMLLLMRIALHTQFLAFLKTGPNANTTSVAFSIQKLLNSLGGSSGSSSSSSSNSNNSNAPMFKLSV